MDVLAFVAADGVADVLEEAAGDATDHVVGVDNPVDGRVSEVSVI